MANLGWGGGHPWGLRFFPVFSDDTLGRAQSGPVSDAMLITMVSAREGRRQDKGSHGGREPGQPGAAPPTEKGNIPEATPQLRISPTPTPKLARTQAARGRLSGSGWTSGPKRAYTAQPGSGAASGSIAVLQLHRWTRKGWWEGSREGGNCGLEEHMG